MVMQLGEMLVWARAVTPAEVDEAVSWQVLYGGRLGTNLLELGLVEEQVLAEALGRQLACEWTCGDISLSASMVQAIPAVVARRHELVPWKIEDKRLKVLCASPQDNLAIFDDLGFRLGKLVRPVVAPEFRIHQCLRRYFDSSMPMRALDFGLQPKGRRAQEAQRKAEQEALPAAADLMDDEAFAAIYREVLAGRQQGAPAVAPPAATARAVSVTGPDTPTLPPGWTAAPVPTPAVDAGSLLKPLDETDEELPLLEAELIEEEVEEAGAPTQDEWAAAFRDLATSAARSEPPPTAEDLSPLDFSGAVAAIGRAEGREGVARAVLRYARSQAARVVLLNVQGDVALGWDAVGDGLSPEIARRIAFPLTVPSAFRLVRESRSHYIGPLGREAGNVRFLKLAGKKWPASAVLLPVLFRGRVVYILYVDNGHRQQVNPDVGELLILSQNISRSMEQLVERRRSAK